MKRYLTTSAGAPPGGKRARSSATQSPSSASASAATDAEGPCPPRVPVGRDHYIRLVTYNTDGLDGGPQLLARAEAAASILLDPWVPFDGLGSRHAPHTRMPQHSPIRVPTDAILLQEVTVVTAPDFISALAGAGYSCYPADIPQRDVGGYFTLLFLRDERFSVLSAERRPFPNSKMGRDLIKVVATLKPTKGRNASNRSGGGGSTTPSPAVPMDIAEGQGEKERFCFLTSHFESLAEPEHARERCAQLSAALDELLSFPGPAVLGADTNLREKEVAAEPKYKRAIDAWVAAGSPPDAKATWDMARNDNKKGFNTHSKPRCRFDRVLLNRRWLGSSDSSSSSSSSSSSFNGEGEDGLVERWELVGTERLTCGVFPSDHFGISCLLRLPPRARPGYCSSGLSGVGERGEGVVGAGVGGNAGGSVNGQTTAATMAEDEQQAPVVVVLD